MNNKKKFTVLIIDDEQDILELMEEEFRYKGHKTFTAISGNAAIKIIDNEKIDIIVSDYKMPNGNGMSVLSYINKLAVKPYFFFVSGQSDVSIEETLKAGARMFFTKPFDLEELVKDIEANIANNSF